MEPAFYRGDLLLLTNHYDEPIRAGEIVVFKIKDRDIPIVHRVIKVHEKYVTERVCYIKFQILCTDNCQNLLSYNSSYTIRRSIIFLLI